MTNVVELPTKTEPAPKDVAGIADWLRRSADELETYYPTTERVIVIRYNPDSDEAFHMSSSGVRHINHTEAVGMLELMVHKMKDEIRK